jgi:hypothetical protein
MIRGREEALPRPAPTGTRACAPTAYRPSGHHRHSPRGSSDNPPGPLSPEPFAHALPRARCRRYRAGTADRARQTIHRSTGACYDGPLRRSRLRPLAWPLPRAPAMATASGARAAGHQPVYRHTLGSRLIRRRSPQDKDADEEQREQRDARPILDQRAGDGSGPVPPLQPDHSDEPEDPQDLDLGNGRLASRSTQRYCRKK